MLAAVHNTGCAIEYASAPLKADKEVVLAAVKRHGEALQFASQELKGDAEVVLAACAQNRDAVAFADSALLGTNKLTEELFGKWYSGREGWGYIPPGKPNKSSGGGENESDCPDEQEQGSRGK